MTHAIRFHKTGGPEVLSWEEVQVGKPGPYPLAGPTTVRIELAHVPQGRPVLRYADRSRHSGRGMLHDSDAAVAEDCFAGITDADLAGRPYPLNNWCAAFTREIDAA